MTPPAAPDAAARGRVLLALARDAVAGAVAGLPEPAGDPRVEGHAGWLLARAATFVTLRVEERLRGCIGTVEAFAPLVADLRRNGHAAATRDPRFPPVAPRELDGLGVEVSLLSALERVPGRTEADVLARLRPGVDGVVLRWGAASGTFLPQVWDDLPDPADFVARLKEKAGLARRFWHPGVEVWRYTVEKWG